MSSALRELIAIFGIEVEDKKLDHLHEKMEGFHSLVEKVGVTLGLAFGLHEISEFIQGQVELGVETLHTSELLGLGVEELQAFQYAAKNAGLGTDEANTAIRFLNKNLGEAASKGGDSAAAFTKLGVKIKDSSGHVRDTKDILADVADGFTKLHSPQEKTAKAMEIFGRAGARMIPLLNKGSKGIEELYGEFEKLGGGMSEDFVESAEKTEHEMNKLNLVWRTGKSTIVTALLPAFTWVIDKATDLVMWFREVSKHSYIVQTALTTLAVIVGVLAVIWAVLNFEVVLVALALALIVLVVDDIYTAFKGGKSVIGDFIDSIFGVGATQATLESLSDIAKLLWEDLKDLGVASGKFIATLFDLDVKASDSRGQLELLRDVVMGIAEALHMAIQAATTLVETLQKIPSPKALARSMLQVGGGTIGGLASAATLAPVVAEADAAGGGDTHNHGDVHNDIRVEVHAGGASDAREVGKQVAGGVRKGIEGHDLQSAHAATPGGG